MEAIAYLYMRQHFMVIAKNAEPLWRTHTTKLKTQKYSTEGRCQHTAPQDTHTPLVEIQMYISERVACEQTHLWVTRGNGEQIDSAGRSLVKRRQESVSRLAASCLQATERVLISLLLTCCYHLNPLSTHHSFLLKKYNKVRFELLYSFSIAAKKPFSGMLN